MGPFAGIPLYDLRAILETLSKDGDIEKRVVSFLRASEPTDPNDSALDWLGPDNYIVLLNQAGAHVLNLLMADLCADKDINERVNKYLELLGHSKPAGADPKASNVSYTIKNATAAELRAVMLSLLGDQQFKKRVVDHILALRRSKVEPDSFQKVDVTALSNSVSTPELRAIFSAMGEGDDDMKERILEYLGVLSISAKLQGPKGENTALQCVKCRAFYREETNIHGSCRYHPGTFKTPVVSGDVERWTCCEDVGRWTCCEQGAYSEECKIQKHVEHN